VKARHFVLLQPLKHGESKPVKYEQCDQSS